MKIRCPRCESEKFTTVGCDNWAIDDVTSYLACDSCNLLYWYSSYLNRISTNGNDCNRDFSGSYAPNPSPAR